MSKIFSWISIFYRLKITVPVCYHEINKIDFEIDCDSVLKA